MLIIAAGLGLVCVPMSLVSLTKVRNADTGVGSSLLNVGQQVGGSIGLAVLGTVAWSAVATNVRSQTVSAAAKAAGHPLTAAAQKQITAHALAVGFSRGSWFPRRSACWRLLSRWSRSASLARTFRRGPDGGACRLRLI